MLVNCIRLTKAKQITTTATPQNVMPGSMLDQHTDIVVCIGNRASKLNHWVFFLSMKNALRAHYIATLTCIHKKKPQYFKFETINFNALFRMQSTPVTGKKNNPQERNITNTKQICRKSNRCI